jgi:hypothetical protein
VLARQRELRGGQGQRLREATNPTSRARVTFEGRAKQFTGLSAKLIEIWAFRQLAHRVFLRAGVRSQALKENGLQPAFERVVEVDSVLPADPEASSKRRVDHTRRWTTRAILFIGNSYTTVNDLPSVFANLARSGGHRVEAGDASVNGWSLADHAGSTATAAKLASAKWDIVEHAVGARRGIPCDRGRFRRQR